MNCSVVVFIGVYVNAYLFYAFINLFSCIPDSYLHEETREGGAGSNARLITNECQTEISAQPFAPITM